MQYVERHWDSQDWITLTLVGCLFLLALAKFLYPKRFEEFIILPVTNKYFLVQGKNETITHPFNALLFIIQVVSISLFVYVAFHFFFPETASNPWLFIQIATIYTVFVLAKFCIEKIVGSIFAMDDIVNSYLYEKLSYRNLITLLLLIANALFFYVIAPSAIIIGIVIALVLLFNGIALFSSYKTRRNLLFKHFFYFILYLCALEISPYIIVYKVWF